MEPTEFMLDLQSRYQSEKHLADSTATAYIKALYSLNGKKPFKNLAWLKKTDEIFERLKDYKDTTADSLLGAAVTTLNMMASPSFRKPMLAYKEKMLEKLKAVKADLATNTKTEKQETNWIKWDEVLEHRKELADKVAKIGKKPTKDEWDTLLQYLLLSVYTEVQPRRNRDYQDMWVVKKWNTTMPTDKNYYDQTGHKFIFNAYKTAKTYGQKVLEVPEPLQTVLAKWISYHPAKADLKKGPIRLLITREGEPIVAQNAITRALNRVFNKKVGSSMLRHIWLSDKYGGQISEMKEDASAMGHSLAEQKEYIKTETPTDMRVFSKSVTPSMVAEQKALIKTETPVEPKMEAPIIKKTRAPRKAKEEAPAPPALKIVEEVKAPEAPTAEVPVKKPRAPRKPKVAPVPVAPPTEEAKVEAPAPEVAPEAPKKVRKPRAKKAD